MITKVKKLHFGKVSINRPCHKYTQYRVQFNEKRILLHWKFV